MRELENAEAILFDLDGVIIDSFNAWYNAFNDTLEKFDKEKQSKKIFRKRHWGPSLDDNMEKLGLGKKGKKYCLSRFHHHIDKVQLLPKAKKLIKSLDRKKGLVTNTPQKPTEKILEKFKIENEFETIISGDSTEKTKPEPEPILKACKNLETSPKNTVLIGDTETDIKSAKRAGSKSIGINVNGDARIENLEELFNKQIKQ